MSYEATDFDRVALVDKPRGLHREDILGTIESALGTSVIVDRTCRGAAS